MWKFVTRGIRETLERRANCRTNVYSQPTQENNTKTNEVRTSLTCNHKLVPPSFSAYSNQFCGSTRSEGTRDKEYEHKWNTKHCWSEAVGWSSILALGWVVCQSMCFRRRLVEVEQKDSLQSKILQQPQTRISYLVSQLLNLQPRHFLPVTSCVGSSAKKLTSKDIETEWSNQTVFGPITAEEALREATDEFANTHNYVAGEYELHYGIKALDEKRYKDAMKHFLAGAQLSSAASMFNLGLCYELGIGTLADQTKAAKYYNDAAKYGHADAIYNIGVFHAQGRGGLTLDIDMARIYFAKAAKLGHIQAQHALDMECATTEPKHISDINVIPEICSDKAHITHDNSICDMLKKVNKYNDSKLSYVNMKQVSEMRQCRQEIPNTKTPTEIFLGLLGLSESNTVSCHSFFH